MKKLNSDSPTLTTEEAFENFLFAKSAQGVTEKTIKSYKSHFNCISKHLDKVSFATDELPGVFSRDYSVILHHLSSLSL